MRLDGKVVLITGASEGIGAACARAFRQRGARLSLTARNRLNLEQVSAPGELITPGDITDPVLRDAVVERTLQHYGTIDVLVNNAGMGHYYPSYSAPPEITRALWELNFFAPLALAQLVVPHMKERRTGAIVNVGSIAGKVTLPWLTIYSASKFALGSLSDGLRMELKPFGIHAMTVCPGYVKTNFQKHVTGPTAPEKILKARRFAITAEQCADDIVRGLERNAKNVITPKSGWLFIVADRLFPSIVESQMAALNVK